MSTERYFYGIDSDLQKKIESKWDPDLAEECKNWLTAVTGETINDLYEDLKSGVILCQLVNKISPKCVKNISTLKSPFKQMENIGNFLKALDHLNIAKTDQFMTVDLYENKNLLQVVQCIRCLGAKSRTIEGFGGPYFGARFSERNERNFDEETLNKVKNEVPQLNQGSFGGSTQSGMFDRTREIIKLPSTQRNPPIKQNDIYEEKTSQQIQKNEEKTSQQIQKNEEKTIKKQQNQNYFQPDLEPEPEEKTIKKQQNQKYFQPDPEPDPEIVPEQDQSNSDEENTEEIIPKKSKTTPSNSDEENTEEIIPKKSKSTPSNSDEENTEEKIPKKSKTSSPEPEIEPEQDPSNSDEENTEEIIPKKSKSGSTDAYPKLCPSCGSPTSGGRFCFNCGAQLK